MESVEKTLLEQVFPEISASLPITIYLIPILFSVSVIVSSHVHVPSSHTFYDTAVCIIDYYSTLLLTTNHSTDCWGYGSDSLQETCPNYMFSYRILWAIQKKSPLGTCL